MDFRFSNSLENNAELNMFIALQLSEFLQLNIV